MVVSTIHTQQAICASTEMTSTTTTTTRAPTNLVARLAPSANLESDTTLRVIISNPTKRPLVLTCKHSSALKVPDKSALLAAAQRSKCDACSVSTDLWLCLTCLGVFCSRDEGLGHGWSHHRDTGHCIAMSLSTLSFWCYAHEQYCEHDFFPETLGLVFKQVHSYKHGEEPLMPNQLPDFDFIDDLLFTPLCPHADALVLSDEDEHLRPELLTSPCATCGSRDENWVCLSCFQVFCGRFSEKHMLEHHAGNSNHQVCLSLSDLSIWCNACQQYLDTFANPKLNAVYMYFYKLKFANLPPQALKRSFDLDAVLDGL
jgi:hypothetical protein